MIIIVIFGDIIVIIEVDLLLYASEVIVLVTGDPGLRCEFISLLVLHLASAILLSQNHRKLNGGRGVQARVTTFFPAIPGHHCISNPSQMQLGSGLIRKSGILYIHVCGGIE